MVLLDTNVFVIDRFFRRDERYEVNRRLVARLPNLMANARLVLTDQGAEGLRSRGADSRDVV